jgi:hypothetical protein
LIDETQELAKEDELEGEIEEEAIISQEKAENEDNTSGEETEEPNEEVEGRTLKPSEPGYDVDDDGLPGEPLPPLPQEVALYPSQELDPNYQIIKRGQGEVYRHDKNLQLDHFLTAVLVLALALVVGLGIGHFLGLSERLEVQEMYMDVQEEKLDILQEDLVSCIDGEEGKGGDDQDLDDRVIRQLWQENQDLRDQVHTLRNSAGPNGEEALASVLRDRINDLLTANADLEREVARLRYADAVRGTEQSRQTLDQLRNTRDSLNDIATENEQLKIEVAKARYGDPLLNKDTLEKSNLAAENKNLKIELENLTRKYDQILNETYEQQQQQEEMVQTPWPTKRHVELNNEDPKRSHKESKRREENKDDENEFKNDAMNNLSKHFASLIGLGNQILNNDGIIDWNQAKRFVSALQHVDLASKFDEAGKLAKADIDVIVNKFEELKIFASEHKTSSLKATKVAAGKLLKSLLGAFKDLREASDDAAEERDWMTSFKQEASKVHSKLNSKWTDIKNNWNKYMIKEELQFQQAEKKKNSKNVNKNDSYEYDDDDDEDDEVKNGHSKMSQQKKGKNHERHKNYKRESTKFKTESKIFDEDDYERKHKKQNKKKRY